MHTTPPIVMARAPKAGAVHPFTRKMAEVAMRVAIVMPETGFEELPINPTMREETVTKRNPKMATSTAAARLASQLTCAPGTGLKVRKKNIINTRTTDPPTTTLKGRSSSVRSGALFTPPLGRRFPAAARKAPKIVGMVLISVISPDAATAPAPMGRMYEAQRSLGDICAIGLVPG